MIHEYWNVHWLFIYIYIYIEHRNLETRKHLRLLSSGTKLFITFECKGSSRKGERGTFFLFWLFHLPPPQQVLHLPQRPLAWLRRASQSQTSSPEAGLNSTQLTFSKSSKSSARARASDAWRHSHPLVNLSVGFLFWHLWTTHPPPHAR